MISTGANAMRVAATPASAYLTAINDSETPRNGPKKAPMPGKGHAAAIAQSRPDPRPPSRQAEDDDKTDTPGDDTDLRSGEGIVVSHSKLRENKPQRLAGGADQTEHHTACW